MQPASKHVISVPPLSIKPPTSHDKVQVSCAGVGEFEPSPDTQRVVEELEQSIISNLQRVAALRRRRQYFVETGKITIFPSREDDDEAVDEFQANVLEGYGEYSPPELSRTSTSSGGDHTTSSFSLSSSISNSSPPFANPMSDPSPPLTSRSRSLTNIRRLTSESLLTPRSHRMSAYPQAGSPQSMMHTLSLATEMAEVHRAMQRRCSGRSSRDGSSDALQIDYD
jgi:hypothetical protein